MLIILRLIIELRSSLTRTDAWSSSHERLFLARGHGVHLAVIWRLTLHLLESTLAITILTKFGWIQAFELIIIPMAIVPLRPFEYATFSVLTFAFIIIASTH